MQPIIRTENLSRWYNVREADHVRAVDDISLAIHEGQWAILSGPSGSGKTTLLSLIGTIDRPTAGKIFFQGKDVTELSDLELSRIRRQKIGIVFQSFNLLSGLSAWENVAYPLIPAGIPSKERHERAVTLLERLGLGRRLNHSSEELSGGEQQRIAIARALINDPLILIADEPTSNIDAHSVQAMLELLSELQTEGKTIVISSHDQVFRNCGDLLFHLDQGKLTETALRKRSP